ncbi:MAG: respiratory chain complex I subunit 1 family protein [Armatimonadota bacterium]
MNTLIYLLLILFNVTVMPLLLVGIIRKVKALMQNRIGSPILQPFYDFAKMIRKTETISQTASWVFAWAPRIGLVVAVLVSIMVPWSGLLLPGNWAMVTNFLLVLYILSLSKFFAMLSAIDTGSAFGGLGASREATISMLVEPTLVMGLAALALGAGSTNLLSIFTAPVSLTVAILVGCALVVAALAELSRMPVDDPTTHLELTMVHEAMILENSGRGLAFIEYASALRCCIFLGLASQTLIRAIPGYHTIPLLTQYGLGLLAVVLMGVAVAVAEGVLVKLKWRSVPNFLVFATVMSMLAALIAAAQA